MSLGDAMRQKSGQLELALEYRGEAPNVRRSVEALTATNGDERSRKLYFSNRRMRTRMSGGVGGEGQVNPVLPYPDFE